VEHVSICNRCKEIDIDACNTHASTILKLNDEVSNLNCQLKICKSEYETIKFARYAYTICRHPSIKDGLGFQKGTKNLTSQRASNLIKEKGKVHMASSLHYFHDKKNHAYLYAHVKNISNIAHHGSYNDHIFYILVMMLFLTLIPCMHHLALHMPMVGIDLGAIMLFLIRLEMQPMAQLFFIILMMLHLCLCVKMIKLLLEMWGLSAREARLAFGFQNLM
jgi:hypothetical protein